jgi:hypothetical protein
MPPASRSGKSREIALSDLEVWDKVLASIVSKP